MSRRKRQKSAEMVFQYINVQQLPNFHTVPQEFRPSAANFTVFPITRYRLLWDQMTVVFRSSSISGRCACAPDVHVYQKISIPFKSPPTSKTANGFRSRKIFVNARVPMQRLAMAVSICECVAGGMAVKLTVTVLNYCSKHLEQLLPLTLELLPPRDSCPLFKSAVDKRKIASLDQCVWY